eukprot:447262-Prorocentrum_minimum.AAC.2
MNSNVARWKQLQLAWYPQGSLRGQTPQTKGSRQRHMFSTRARRTPLEGASTFLLFRSRGDSDPGVPFLRGVRVGPCAVVSLSQRSAPSDGDRGSELEGGFETESPSLRRRVSD